MLGHGSPARSSATEWLRRLLQTPPAASESLTHEAFDDGWTELDEAPKKLRTVLHLERAKTIITTNDSPDIGFDQSINPYRGCEHGCIYCYARPAHAWSWLLAVGRISRVQLFFKPEAAGRARGKGAEPEVATRAEPDPHRRQHRSLPADRAHPAHHPPADRGAGPLQPYPFSIITKSGPIVRDLDLYTGPGRAGPARTAVSMTTLDRKLARAMEPRAATPERRLDAIQAAGPLPACPARSAVALDHFVR